VQEAEALLRNAISDLNIRDTFQYHFLRIARENTSYIILPLEDIEFDDIEKKLNYSSLADKGFDTIVWIDNSEICLTTKNTTGINPSLSFIMTFNVDLIRAKDGELVYRYIWKKECDDDEFVDWADNYAEPFRKEFNRCCKSVAKQIVEDLFLTKPQKIRLEKEKEYFAYIPKSVKSAALPLRKQPEKNLKEIKIFDMLSQYGFFDSKLNPDSSFDNVFIDNQNKTITDQATKLMWEKKGSRFAFRKNYALIYVKKLNKKRFAGYSDWRMPTIEELASLLSKNKTGNLHIDPVFDNQQIRCWSSDGAESLPGSSITVGWVADYNYGKIKKATWYDKHDVLWQPWHEVVPVNYVRAVRSIPQTQIERSEEDADFTTINLLDHAFHMGDNNVSRFRNPKPQGIVFEGRFNITDTNLSTIFITIWVSDLVPKNHNQFLRGYYKTKLLINDSEIGVLNNHISGIKDQSKIEQITIGVDKHIVKKGYNEIKIIAGYRGDKNNYDDFQIHKIIVRYKE